MLKAASSLVDLSWTVTILHTELNTNRKLKVWKSTCFPHEAAVHHISVEVFHSKFTSFILQFHSLSSLISQCNLIQFIGYRSGPQRKTCLHDILILFRVGRCWFHDVHSLLPLCSLHVWQTLEIDVLPLWGVTHVARRWPWQVECDIIVWTTYFVTIIVRYYNYTH